MWHVYIWNGILLSHKKNKIKLFAATQMQLGVITTRFDPWVRQVLCRREWQSTPGFLPGESHGQRSLVGYSPWGRRESDTTTRGHHTK